MPNGLDFQRRPRTYEAPDWPAVQHTLERIRKKREKKIADITRIKKARRDQWDHLLNQIPAAWRKMAPLMGFPDVAEMAQRIAGMISSQEPIVEVMPPSGRVEDVRKAANEESRLHAVRITVEDQQDRSIYAMGIDAQVNWGESWITVLPDPYRAPYADEEDAEEAEKTSAVEEAERILGYRRGEKESADSYLKRARTRMAYEGVPLVIEDHDPQTVYPLRVPGGQLKACIIESEHTLHDIETGLGYKAAKGADGKRDWMHQPFTIGVASVPDDVASPTSIVDIDHDNPRVDGSSASVESHTVKRVIYLDCWVVQVYLDGVKVEEWKHGWGLVPCFPALGEQTSDQEDGEDGRSVIEGAVTLASQIIVASATLTANAKLHGFPTPFLKNPDHGMSYDRNFEPPIRKVHHGELNMLGIGEEIEFPFLNAHMGPDFYRNLEMLMNRLEAISIAGWGKDVSPETSGYAIAQIRAMQNSILGPIYRNAARQWRKIFAFVRFLVRTFFPAGLWLRGAVETREVEGKEFTVVPIVRYAKEDTTDFQINVRIEEGILQDEMAERKSAIEMHEAGAWSMRRVREQTGVEDPVREGEEIDIDRQLKSPAMDQQRLILAMAMAAERYQATQSQNTGAFANALAQAKQAVLGAAAGQGNFDVQGGMPVNALPGGQPMQQNPAPPAPQQGGPTQGPTTPPLTQMGVPGIPGGVEGGQPPVR